MIVQNPGPIWIFITSPERALIAPGDSYEAPAGTQEITWLEYPTKPEPHELPSGDTSV